MKYAILLAALILPCSVIHGQQSSSKASAQQSNTNKPIANATQATQSITVNEQEPEKSPQNTNSNGNHANSYLDMLSSENLSTTILAVVGIVGIVVAICTLKSIQEQAGLMEKQLGEMQESGKQAARQLSLTERPWISVSLKLIGPLTANDTEVRLPLLVEATNVGKSPALGIMIELVPYVLNPERPSIAIEQRRIADQAKAVSAANPVFGDMLFPGSPPLLRAINIPITVNEIDKYSIVGDESYSFVVILGVGYRSTIDETTKHCTCVVYDANRIDLKYPAARFVFRKGETLGFCHLEQRVNSCNLSNDISAERRLSVKSPARRSQTGTCRGTYDRPSD